MVTIVTRAGKGSPLTSAELDANFNNLNNGLGTGASITYYGYSDRGDLRTATPTDNEVAVIDGLGLFIYLDGSEEVDDDETCFATAAGRWLMQVPHPDFISAYFPERSQKIITRIFDTKLSSVANGATIKFEVSFPEYKRGDGVLVTFLSDSVDRQRYGSISVGGSLAGTIIITFYASGTFVFPDPRLKITILKE